MKPYGEIYVITNLVNGKKYVGQTKGAVGARWNEHIKRSRNGKLINGVRRFTRLQFAIRKHGQEKFTIEKLETGPITNQEELNAAEMSAIERLGTHSFDFGYNCTVGGDGIMIPEIERVRIAAVKIALARPDVKARLSASSFARSSRPEYLERMGSAVRAAHSSSRVKARHRAACKAAHASPEVRARHGAAAKAVRSRPGMKAHMVAVAKIAYAKKRRARELGLLPYPLKAQEYYGSLHGLSLEPIGEKVNA